MTTLSPSRRCAVVRVSATAAGIPALRAGLMPTPTLPSSFHVSLLYGPRLDDHGDDDDDEASPPQARPSATDHARQPTSSSKSFSSCAIRSFRRASRVAALSIASFAAASARFARPSSSARSRANASYCDACDSRRLGARGGEGG